jgi:hypothetical protein
MVSRDRVRCGKLMAEERLAGEPTFALSCREAPLRQLGFQYSCANLNHSLTTLAALS